jgi:putative sigma-54 modulation protein
MNLQITTRHFDLTRELRAYAEERVRKIKRYFDQIIDVNVILISEKHRQVAEISLHLNGHNLVGRSVSAGMRTSIDQAVERIESQIKKHKDRLTRDRRGRTHLGEAMAAEAESSAGVEIEDETEE